MMVLSRWSCCRVFYLRIDLGVTRLPVVRALRGVGGGRGGEL